MGQEGKEVKQSLTFRRLLIKLFWFCCTIVLLIVLAMPIIYLFGSDTIYQSKPHPLYTVFGTDHYKDIYNSMDTFSQINLYGKRQEGMIEFLKNFANVKTEKGIEVIMEPLTSKDDFTIEQIFEEIKKVYEDYLNLVEQLPTYWILITIDDEVPHEQLIELYTRYPKDKFILVTNEPLPANFIPKHKRLQYPGLNQQEFLHEMQHSFDIDHNISNILFDFYNRSIVEVFNNIDTFEYSHSEVLGDEYRSPNQLTKQDKKLLLQLCLDGKAQSEKQSENLVEFGAAFYKKHYYWYSKYCRLNYQLLSGIKCVETRIPQSIRLKMQKQQEEKLKKLEQQAQKKLQIEKKKKEQAKRKIQARRQRKQN